MQSESPAAPARPTDVQFQGTTAGAEMKRMLGAV
jgi:hypothetical protein